MRKTQKEELHPLGGVSGSGGCDGEGVPSGYGDDTGEDTFKLGGAALAYLGAKYGGNFELFRQADLDAVVEKLKSGSSMEAIAKDMKYYAYYREAYGRF